MLLRCSIDEIGYGGVAESARQSLDRMHIFRLEASVFTLDREPKSEIVPFLGFVGEAHQYERALLLVHLAASGEVALRGLVVPCHMCVLRHESLGSSPHGAFNDDPTRQRSTS